MPAAPQQYPIRVLPHIRQALDAGAPVVALESSVLAQGLPVPANAAAAIRMQSAVESAGAMPAITAVVRGQATLGLQSSELDRFLRRDGIRKVSARDLGFAMARAVDGATTVAAALAISSRVGVRVFATGGIGGVHRELPSSTATHARDESADLGELARTPMVVVCAGAKSILDLAATWERLDTLGIPVVGFGTDEFPGFFTRHSGIELHDVATTPAQIAEIAAAHFAIGRPQSVLVVQPPPAEVALDAVEVEAAVRVALDEVGRAGVHGGAVTPWLLQAVSTATAGRTLEANLGLLGANARLAGEIAAALQPIAR